MTRDEILRDLWTASWMSKGQPPNDTDQAYWLKESPGMIARGPQIGYHSQVFPQFDAGRAYQMDRMLGWQSGGSDIPPYGNWASPPKPWHDVPPYPGDAVTPAPGVPAPPPEDRDRVPHPPATPSTDLATVLATLDQHHGAVLTELRALKTALAAIKKLVTAKKPK